MNMVKNLKPKLVKIKLVKDHYHHGILHLAGAELELRVDQAERLEQQRIGFRQRYSNLKEG